MVLYYRFCFRPSDGQVTLAHNDETHPAQARYHTDLAAEANEPGTYHGYAYRIGGGWRITNWDHKSVEDPFIVAQVLRAIRGKEGSSPAPRNSDTIP